MTYRKVAILAILLLTLAIFILYFGLHRTADDPNKIFVSGNIEITEVQASFQVPGRVEQRKVDEGDIVKAGDLIANLDATDFLQEVALRKAELDAAQANYLELVHGYLPEEIAQAQAKFNQTKADFEKLEVDYKRQKELYDQQVISTREYDVSFAAYEVAKARKIEAEEYLTLLQKGTRVERIVQAEARVKQAQETLAIAETRLGYATIYSPLNGWVLSKNIEPGEYVSPGTPIVTIGNLNDVWLRAYIDETELGKVKLGQKVAVKTDTYPDKVYDGTIVFISSEAEFTPKNVQTEKLRVKLVYRIKIDLPNPNMELKPGMPADGTISLDSL